MLIKADARHIPLRDKSVQCVVTSPPYWGLRSYGTIPLIWDGDSNCRHEWGEFTRTPWANKVSGPNGRVKNLEASKKVKYTGPFCLHCGAWRGDLGLEPDYRIYTSHMVQIFREVWRVLKDEGVLFLNLGDSYATCAGKVSQCPGGGFQGERFKRHFGKSTPGSVPAMTGLTQPNRMPQPGLKPKDLVGIPWRIAFALQADGWYLRSDIIWDKPNPMPSSVSDRPTLCHEYIFLLSKKSRYYYDADSIREPYAYLKDAKNLKWVAGWADKGSHAAIDHAKPKSHKGSKFTSGKTAQFKHNLGDGERHDNPLGRNKRTVWHIPTSPFNGAHFATFPREIPETFIKAGSRKGDVILDPFCGSATTVIVAQDLGRIGIGLDLTYQDLAAERIGGSLFKKVVNSAMCMEAN